MDPDTTADWLQLFSAANVLLFASLMVYGAVSASMRLARYRLAGQRPPKLLWRDVGMIVSWSGLIVLILIVRAFRSFGADHILWIDISNLNESAWWLVSTGVLATFGAWIFVRYERRIEREERPEE